MKTFYPNNDNLGGKKIIDTHKSNHILSILNATPQVNSLKIPHAHVNGAQRNKQKNIEVLDYFKEVNETYKRINNMKHGSVNHSKPNTFHLKNSISKRMVYEKNIILHDHLRNIKHLGNSLKMINIHSEKNIETIKSKAIAFKSENSSQKMKTRTKSNDFPFAGNLIENYNPFAQNIPCYDSADCSVSNQERIVGGFEKPYRHEENDENLKSEKNLKTEFDFFKFEADEMHYEFFKRKMIECVVKNKIYSIEQVLYLKEKITENNEDLDKGLIEEVFEELIQYFFK